MTALLLALLLAPSPATAAAVPDAGASAGQVADTAAAGDRAGTAIPSIRVEGAISPVTTNYVRRGIEAARERGAPALLVELDTPGGLLESTKEIVQAIYEAGRPVIVYVSPEGARAASAGTFITLAAHVAAMAPSTTIGAASPVTMGGGGQQDTVMQKKLFEYAESFIRSIADRRDRNVEWAASAVREGASITASEAAELEVIDLVASDREELLRAVDGRVVEGDTLRTAGATVEEIPPNLAERFLGLIMRPEVMLILTMVAIYGIVGEVTSPGAIVPGVTGVIALILLLYASAAMPINTAGYLLVALALILFAAEAFTPTFGLLVTGGAVAFFLGGLMLFQDLPEPMRLGWAWLVPATVVTALFFLFVAGAGIKAQLAPARTGTGTMVGKRAEVVDPVDASGGRVFVDGEYWNAVSEEPLEVGTTCVIETVEGLRMKVRPPDGEGEAA